MRNLATAALTGWVAAWMLAGSAGRLRAADDKPVDLAVGAAAPAFEGIDDAGKAWKSGDHVGKKVVVLYCYPGDFTPGCTAQARNFRDSMNKLIEQGVEVVGVSGDSARSHELFKKVQKLNFTLLADEEGALAKKFGVPVSQGAEVKARGEDGKILKDDNGAEIVIKRGVTLARWTFIIGKDGRVAYKNTRVNPVLDSKEVAAFIEKMQKK
jgi:thioredoxin-dependent peroxiredoxin